MNNNRNLGKIADLLFDPIQEARRLVRSRGGNFRNPSCAGCFVENKNIRKCAANIDTNHEAAHAVPSRQFVP